MNKEKNNVSSNSEDELLEDLYWDALATQRDEASTIFVSHDDAWAFVLSQMPSARPLSFARRETE